MKPVISSRINAFDLLRGWCLVVICSDHLMRFPSIFDILTGRGLLWVTAAEGFFFISGALTGIVRGRKMHTHGLRTATKLLWQRAWKLYLASITLTLGFTALAVWLQSRGIDSVKGGVETFGSVWMLLWQTLTLQYSYGWTDFLNYYVVFLLISPAALWLCRRGKWWVVLGSAIVLWLSKGIFHHAVLESFMTWQSYFFIGLVFGYQYKTIHAWWRSLTDRGRRNILTTAYTATGLTIFASFAFTFGTPIFEHHSQLLFDFFRNVKDNAVFTYLFQNNRSGLLRLPLFLLWFGSLFMLVRRYESKIMRWLGWLLMPLGQNSLYVYILGGIIIFGVHLSNIPQLFLINSALTVAVIMLCWYAVQKRFLFAVIPR